MGAQQREYKKRIRSAQGMQKIFKAQEMIAAARISKAHARVRATTPYAEAITRAIGAVATHSRSDVHPYLDAERSKAGGAAGVLLITADRGMAGSYAPNAIRAAEQLANTLIDEGKQVQMFVVGRKGDSYYRFRNRPPVKAWTSTKEEDIPQVGHEIADELNARLLSEDPETHLDELFVVGTTFTNRFVQDARVSRLVPMAIVEDADADAGTFPLYEFVPDAETVLADLIPRYVEARIINILLQSQASEHAARQRAMKTATDNADAQITKFTRLANAARQAEITQEITEIVGGASALSGAGRTTR